MSDLGMNLGDLIASGFGEPVDREGAYAAGQLRSAQTESAIVPARATMALPIGCSERRSPIIAASMTCSTETPGAG